ncbi:MAG: energy transducer TonB [Deltaproteobacteria bacterium]|nr:energy transducer TonB [Deltaproteobacteria bacterium]
MKQILTAGVLALVIHGLLFAMDFKWSGKRSLDIIKPRALNMTLTSIPIRTTPKPSLQKPKPIVKKPAIVKKKKSKPKRILKAPPKKTVRIPVQSKKIEVPETIPEKTAENTESHFDSEPTESKELLKAGKQSAAPPSPFKMIHEARPIYRLNPSPKYPRIARIRGYQGNVLLDVLVNKDGKVHDLKIYKSSGHPLLDRSAAYSVKHWLFEPGMIGKKKTDTWVRVPIRFELRE